MKLFFAVNFLLLVCFSEVIGVSAPRNSVFEENGFVLKGKVSDSKTKLGIPGVSIYVNETFVGTITNGDGNYVLNVPVQPATLVFSCIGYTRRSFTFNTPPKEDFNVMLDPAVQEIPEVLITGKRTPVSISDEQDLYVTDYEFYDNHILLLGHPGKRSTQTLLVLMDRMGKRILKREIRKGENLYRDPFNNLHLLTADSAYQVFFDGSDFQLLYPTGKERFMKAFPEFLELYHNKVILRQYDFEDQAMLYYFYNLADSTIDRFWVGATPEVYHKIERVRAAIRITPDGKGTSRFNLFNADERFVKMAYYSPIFCPLEIIRDTIYIFNFPQGIIETFGPRGNPVDTPTAITFQTIDGWQKRLYNDVVTGKVYTEFLRNGITELREINVKNGSLSPTKIIIPNFENISKLMVNDGFLYFLYEERLYPNYMRLFRMQL
jgi:hypothetical protein